MCRPVKVSVNQMCSPVKVSVIQMCSPVKVSVDQMFSLANVNMELLMMSFHLGKTKNATPKSWTKVICHCSELFYENFNNWKKQVFLQKYTFTQFKKFQEFKQGYNY